MESTNVVPAESLPLESPQSDIDAEGAALREQLTADPSLLNASPEAAPEEPKQATSAQEGQQRTADAVTKESKPDNSETSAEPVIDSLGRKHDPKTGRLLPKDEQVEAEAVTEQKPESEYAKAKKEAERQKGVLAGFEEKRQAEWARIKAAEQQLAQREAQLQQQAQRGQQPRFSSKDLWAASTDFDTKAEKLIAEGDMDGAKEQLTLARNARQAAQQSFWYEQQQGQQAEAQKRQQAWESGCAEVFREEPELQKVDENGTPQSEQAADMMKVLQANPELLQFPRGFKLAYEYLKVHWKAQTAEASELRAVTAEKQLKELQERTSLSGSGPVSRTEKRLEDLPLDEWGEELRRQISNDPYA